MIKNQKKVGFVAVLFTLLITAGNLSALTVTWGASTTAVPLSNTSLMILSALLMGVSTLFILKSKTGTQKFLMSAFLLTALFSFSKEAYAAVSGANIIIDSAVGNGTVTANPSGNKVINSFTSSVKLTGINFESGCHSVSGTTCAVGMTLSSGNECSIIIICGET